MFICIPSGNDPNPTSQSRVLALVRVNHPSERVVDLVRPKRNERMPSGRRDGEKNREKARRIPTARAPPRVIARTARRGPIVARFARDPAVLSARIAPPATRGRRATRERDATSRDAGANETETVRRASSSPFGRAFAGRRHRSSSRPRSTADRFAGCGFFAPKRRVVTRQTRWDTKRKASGRRASGTHRESHDERARESEDRTVLPGTIDECARDHSIWYGGRPFED